MEQPLTVGLAIAGADCYDLTKTIFTGFYAAIFELSTYGR